MWPKIEVSVKTGKNKAQTGNDMLPIKIVIAIDNAAESNLRMAGIHTYNSKSNLAVSDSLYYQLIE